MSDELIQFTIDGQMEEENAEEFRYDVLDQDDREFIQSQEYEIRTHWNRAAEEILSSGRKLLLVQATLKQANKGKHGSFEGWLKKVRLSRSNAFFAMKAFSRFGDDKKFPMETFSSAAFKALTYASDEVVEQVMLGKINPPTRDAINKAEKDRKDAEEQAKQAKLAERQARIDAEVAQQQLELIQEASQTEIEELTKHINALKEEMEKLTTPEVEIREVKKEVVPQSVTLQIETLQTQIQTLTNSLETQKKTIPFETQRTLEVLQKQVEKLKAEREQQQLTIQSQEERITKQNEDIQAAIRKREFAENQDRIRQSWRQSTSEAHACLMRVLGQWPTPVDVQSFDADDWARVDHLKNTLKRVIEECDGLRYQTDHHIIDEEQSPYALRVIDA